MSGLDQAKACTTHGNSHITCRWSRAVCNIVVLSLSLFMIFLNGEFFLGNGGFLSDHQNHINVAHCTVGKFNIIEKYSPT